MIGGLEGGGCPTFLEGRGGVGPGGDGPCGPWGIELRGVSKGMTGVTICCNADGATLARELLELVSLRPEMYGIIYEIISLSI